MSQNGTTRRVVPTDDGGNEMPDRLPNQVVAVQRVQTPYSTAIDVQRPRVIRDVERRVLEEASKLGARAFYAWGDGKDYIEGGSIELAMVLARNYTNLAMDKKEVQETPDAWIFTAILIDLETGFTYPRQFRQSKKWQIKGKYHEERKDDMRFQIGQSKADRNAILRFMPAWLVDAALDKAKDGVRDEIQRVIDKDPDPKKGMATTVALFLKKLADLGVDEARVLRTIDRPSAAAITIDDLVVLQGKAAAIKSKAETADAMFPEDDDAPKGPDPDAVRAKRAEREAAKQSGGSAEPADDGATPTTVGNDVDAMKARLDEARAKAGVSDAAPAPVTGPEQSAEDYLESMKHFNPNPETKKGGRKG